jgi:hypothetical protein
LHDPVRDAESTHIIAAPSLCSEQAHTPCSCCGSTIHYINRSMDNAPVEVEGIQHQLCSMPIGSIHCTVQSKYTCSQRGTPPYVQVAGCGAPVLLVHGFGVNYRQWRQTISAVAKENKVWLQLLLQQCLAMLLVCLEFVIRHCAGLCHRPAWIRCIRQSSAGLLYRAVGRTSGRFLSRVCASPNHLGGEFHRIPGVPRSSNNGGKQCVGHQSTGHRARQLCRCVLFCYFLVTNQLDCYHHMHAPGEALCKPLGGELQAMQPCLDFIL